MTKKNRDKIAIIGAGRLGTALGFALARAGDTIAAVADINLEAAVETQHIIGQGSATEDIVQAAENADVVLLTPRDEALKACTAKLSSSPIIWQGKIVLHCSGHYPTRILQPLAGKGADTASCHPVQTFADKKPSAGIFSGIYFGLEGSGRALDWARDMILRLEGKEFLLREEDKALYHTACSLASNGLVAVLDAAVAAAQKAGLDEPAAIEIFFPLIQKTLQNVKKIGIAKALSGPVMRGDLTTVEDHLSALEAFPGLRNTYRALAAQALEIVKRRSSTNPDSVKPWQRLLEDK
jgi:predicted short-subunit dehydrogenase-like oxidoreductase (DUF2520 family)